MPKPIQPTINISQVSQPNPIIFFGDFRHIPTRKTSVRIMDKKDNKLLLFPAPSIMFFPAIIEAGKKSTGKNPFPPKISSIIG